MDKVVEPTVEVSIVIDVICSGSYIGFTRFRRVADRFRAGGGKLQISFLPFQLDPDAPPYGEPLLEVLVRKFGPDVVTHNAQAEADAAQEGLRLNYEQAVAANSFEAHRLIAAAAEQGRAEEMTERLFRAHFTDGLDIGDQAILSALAGEIGVTPGGVSGEEIRSRLARVRALGVTAIPVFFFDNEHRLAGVPPEETLAATLRRTAAV